VTGSRCTRSAARRPGRGEIARRPRLRSRTRTAAPVAVGGRPGRRERVLDAVDLSEVFGGGPGLVTGDQDLHRGERASRHTATFEALQSVIRLTVVSEGIRRGRADLGAEEHADQGEQHGESAAGGEPPVPDDQRGPAAHRRLARSSWRIFGQSMRSSKPAPSPTAWPTSAAEAEWQERRARIGPLKPEVVGTRRGRTRCPLPTCASC
jgi:hypothetical protein